MLILQHNFGSISVHQRVLLRLHAYPQEQYGMLEGTMFEIKPIATDSGFLARVALPANLQTNWKKPILFREGLLAEADIVIANQNLLERFYLNAMRQIKR